MLIIALNCCKLHFNDQLRMFSPEVSQLRHFLQDSSVFYLNDPCYFFCPITPIFLSDFQDIGLKYSFDKIFQNCHYSVDIFLYIENAISAMYFL